MIRGEVNEDGVPVVAISLGHKNWPAIIDTGFNGDLELPEELRSQLNPKFVFRARSLLAGGQSIDEDCYLIDFPFDGRTVTAEATFSIGSEILIGTQLIAEYRLQIDFVAGTVEMERLDAE